MPDMECKMVRGLATQGRDKTMTVTTNNPKLIAGFRKMPGIHQNGQRTGQWHTETDTERQRAEQSLTQAGLEGRDKNVGTAPSSCSGLISGPSARHGIKQTGESWVRAGHKTPGRGEGRDGLISQWEISLSLIHRESSFTHLISSEELELEIMEPYGLCVLILSSMNLFWPVYCTTHNHSKVLHWEFMLD